MFGSLGMPEILLILVIALLIFGPRKLPEVGRTIGKGLSEFRRASSDFKRTINTELALEEDERQPTTRRPLGPAQPTEGTGGRGRIAGEPETAPTPTAATGTTPRDEVRAAAPEPTADAPEVPAAPDAADTPADGAPEATAPEAAVPRSDGR